MSVCCFCDNEDEVVKTFLEEGYVKVGDSIKPDLIGKTLNIRYCKPSKHHTEIGGVFLITKFEDDILYARNAPYRGSNGGEEIPLPKNLWYMDLSKHQAKCFIPPKTKRVRELPPISLCPQSNGVNYPINDPENSFIPREKLLDTQCYLTHDNGGRPLKVLAHKNAIEIYGDDELIWDEEQIYNNLIVTYTDFIGIWPGYDSADYSEFDIDTNKNNNKENDVDSENMMLYHCSCSEYGQTMREDHNSILIQLSLNDYIFVGDCVYSFKTSAPIINYYSPVGNNDVPYPVAYGQNEVYFMLDRVYVNKDQLITPCTSIFSEQMYGEFYGHDDGPVKNPIDMIDVTVIHKRCY